MSHPKQYPPTGYHNPAYRPAATLLVTAVLTLAVFAVMVAASYPVAALVASAVAVTTIGAVRTIRRRRIEHETARTVCVPHTGVCLRV